MSRAYNIVFGLFQAPYYSYSQTMMAELTPPGFDNMVSIYRQPNSNRAERVVVFRSLRAFQSGFFHDWA